SSRPRLLFASPDSRICRCSTRTCASAWEEPPSTVSLRRQQRVTTFALRPGSLRSSIGPARFGSSEYLAQAQALLDISAGLTDEQKMIAEYWADGPHSELPPGHWNLAAGEHQGDPEGAGGDGEVASLRLTYSASVSPNSKNRVFFPSSLSPNAARSSASGCRKCAQPLRWIGTTIPGSSSRQVSTACAASQVNRRLPSTGSFGKFTAPQWITATSMRLRASRSPPIASRSRG